MVLAALGVFPSVDLGSQHFSYTPWKHSLSKPGLSGWEVRKASRFDTRIPPPIPSLRPEDIGSPRKADSRPHFFSPSSASANAIRSLLAFLSFTTHLLWSCSSPSENRVSASFLRSATSVQDDAFLKRPSPPWDHGPKSRFSGRAP